jgi:hypothetical protein
VKKDRQVDSCPEETSRKICLVRLAVGLNWLLADVKDDWQMFPE